MAINWVTPVRGVQLVIAIIVMGLAAYTVSFIDGFAYIGTFNQGAYNVFVGLWTILVTAYLIVVGVFMSDSALANPIILLVVEGLTWVFWVAAFACMAAFVNGYTGPGNFPGACNAIIAFGVIEWLLFTATLIWNGIRGFGGGKSGGVTDHQGV